MKFEINSQTLKRIDDDKIIADSQNYLKAEFTFSDDWSGLNKVAQFTKDSTTYNVDITNGVCTVPWEALVGGGVIFVNVFGGDLITVNECTVFVGRSGLREGQLPHEPTEGYFDSIVNTVKGDRAAAESAAITATNSAGTAVTEAQSAAQNKAVTDQNAQKTSLDSQNAAQMANIASEAKAEAQYYANKAQALLSSMPMRYYRASIAEMEAIENPVQGDLCYVTDFNEGESNLYVYDTLDIDNDDINPEWVFLGRLEFANLDRDTLLGILNLASVAISGNFKDLTNIPNKYNSPITLDGTGSSVIWDYSLSDNAVVVITGNKPIEISNLYPGCEGIISVYGALLNVDCSNPMIGALVPAATEHMVYSFYSRDGVHIDWTALPYEGATL